MMTVLPSEDSATDLSSSTAPVGARKILRRPKVENAVGRGGGDSGRGKRLIPYDAPSAYELADSSWDEPRGPLVERRGGFVCKNQDGSAVEESLGHELLPLVAGHHSSIAAVSPTPAVRARSASTAGR